MLFFDIHSFVYIVLFLVLYNLARKYVKQRYTQKVLLLIANYIVIGTIAKWDQLLAMTVVSLLVYFLGEKISQQSNKVLFYSTLTGLIVAFILKNYQIVGMEIIQRVGMSYILFRLIHFLIECRNHKISEKDPLSFINYILFFPSYLAGPIDTYKNFHYWLNRGKSTFGNLLVKAGIVKVVIGVFKKYFLVPLIINYALTFAHFPEDLSWQLSLGASLIFYSFYILFDFSGYSDIAIGTAYLMGIQTPENFNRPYLASNLSSFWKRWHMTFSNFLFQYVFIPFANLFPTKKGSSSRLKVTFLAYIVTFILCGIWHGNTVNFIYWGLWHAIGLIGFKLFALKFSNTGKWKKIGGVMVTFSFVTIGWFFFNYNTATTHLILGDLVNRNDFKVKTNIVSHKNRKKILLVSEEKLNQPKILLFNEKMESIDFHVLALSSDSLIIEPKEKIEGLYKMVVSENNQQSIQLDYFLTSLPASSLLQENLFWNYSKTKIID